MTGETLPNIAVHIVINDQDEYDTESDENGKYAVDVTHLRHGLNMVYANIEDSEVDVGCHFFVVHLVLHEPRDGEIFFSDGIWAKGNTLPEYPVKIVLNGTDVFPITSDEEGEFSVFLPKLKA